MIEAIIGYVVQAVIDEVLSKVSSDAYDRIKKLLNSDTTKRAFKLALSKTITMYSQGNRLLYAQAFTKEKGLLHDKDVVTELAKLVRVEGDEPSYQLIGARWKLLLEDTFPVWRNYDEDAKVFLRYFENELKNTDVFRDVFQLKNLERIANTSEISAAELQRIFLQLVSLNEVAAQGFKTLIDRFGAPSNKVQNTIHDFSSYVEEKSRSFIGRKFVLDNVSKFINENARGYFILKGDPGIGKTAISAQLVKQYAYPHHFVIRSSGMNKPRDFHSNICSQLIALYNLNYDVLPPTVGEDGRFLIQILNEVSQRLGQGKCVIVVDALDEVDTSNISEGANTLYLPSTLPMGIFFFVTTRREDEATVRLRIDISEQRIFFIKQDEPDNLRDIRTFVSEQSANSSIQAYIVRNNINMDVFVNHLVEKSQGNFIYTRFVLRDIEDGRFQELAFNEIPLGLQSYYRYHWVRIKRNSGLDWFDYRLPIVLALTVIKEPVSFELILKYSNVADGRKVRAVLDDFDQFLYKMELEYDEQIVTSYRWYHGSFFDFIERLSGVKEELVDLRKAHKIIARKMLDDLKGRPST